MGSIGKEWLNSSALRITFRHSKPIEESRCKVRFPKSSVPAQRWAEVGSLRMRYLDWGGGGAPVLALHGLASSAHWYDILAPFLCERFRIVAPDQRGHGGTTQAADGYGWRSLASDAVGLLDVLGIEQAVLLGHSWGGNVAVAAAAHFPGRVRALVMIDGGFVGPEMVPGGTWEDFSSRFAPRDVSGTRSDFLARIRGQLEVCWNSEVERIVQTMVEERDGQIHDILRPGSHSQILRAMWDDPTSDYWPRIRCPDAVPSRRSREPGNRQRLRPRPQAPGETGSRCHPRLPRALDTRHRPRHRLSQAAGAGRGHSRVRRFRVA